MKRISSIAAKVVRRVVLPALLIAGCSTESPIPAPKKLPAVAFEELGPFGVGVTTRGIARPAVTPQDPRYRDPEFKVEIWYPTAREGAWQEGARDRTPYSGLAGFAVRDLPILEGYERFPLIIFSHGLQAIREQNNFQTQYLASRGYVVMSGDHLGSLLVETMAEDGITSLDIGSSLLNRPHEVFAQLDAMDIWSRAEGSMFRDKVDASRTIVIGHSFGGYSALAAGGGTLNFDTVMAQCFARPELYDSLNCRVMRNFCKAANEDVAEPTIEDCASALDDILGPQRVFHTPDSRVAGIMPMTPGATPLFDEGGLDTIDVPVFLWAGGSDEVVEPDLFIDWVYADLRVPKFLAEVEKAGHLNFSQICQFDLPDYCGLEMPHSGRAVLEMINEVTAAFADWILRGDPAGLAWLSSAELNQKYPHTEFKSQP